MHLPDSLVGNANTYSGKTQWPIDLIIGIIEVTVAVVMKSKNKNTMVNNTN